MSASGSSGVPIVVAVPADVAVAAEVGVVATDGAAVTTGMLESEALSSPPVEPLRPLMSNAPATTATAGRAPERPLPPAALLLERLRHVCLGDEQLVAVPNDGGVVVAGRVVADLARTGSRRRGSSYARAGRRSWS